jgi:hypothetical protein
MPNSYTLKMQAPHFQAFISGNKRADMRVNDNRYLVGDTITFEEVVSGQNSGRSQSATVTYVQAGTGINLGYVCLSLALDGGVNE